MSTPNRPAPQEHILICLRDGMMCGCPDELLKKAAELDQLKECPTSPLNRIAALEEQAKRLCDAVDNTLRTDNGAPRIFVDAEKSATTVGIAAELRKLIGKE